MRACVRACWFIALLLALPVGVPGAQAAPTNLADTPLRAPQIRITPFPLDDVFQSLGQPIAPARDQRVVGLFDAGASSYSLVISAVRLRPDAALYVYNGHDPQPTLTPLIPVGASEYWFCIVYFLTNPNRVRVDLFDDTATLLSRTTTLGIDRSGFGFTVVDSSGSAFTQDARNAGGLARALAFAVPDYARTAGYLAFETRPGPTPASDFVDAVFSLDATYPGIVSTNRTTWGALKARFR